MNTFIAEIGKYFGDKYSGDQRKQYLRELFDENHSGYHEKEKEYIRAYKPFFEKGNYVEKKYYLLYDGESQLDFWFKRWVHQQIHYARLWT